MAEKITEKDLFSKPVSDMSEARQLVRRSLPTKTYQPRGNKSDYDDSLDKYLRLINRK